MVVRQCSSKNITEETRNLIKNSNELIDIVLDDGRGNLLFCHEAKEAQWRDVERPQQDQHP